MYILMLCWPKDTEGFALGSNAICNRVFFCLARWPGALHEGRGHVKQGRLRFSLLYKLLCGSC